MLPLIHIVIADEDQDFVNNLRTLLTFDHGFVVDKVCSSGIGLTNILNQYHPDLLVLDYAIGGVNVLTLLHDISQMPNDVRPAVFVNSPFISSYIAAECERLGVKFLLREPIDPHHLVDLFRRYSTPHSSVTVPMQNELSLHIAQFLNSLHVPPHLKGYRYLIEAVVLTIEDRSSADAVTKELYPIIAKKHHVKWESVERNIRNAVELAWQRSGEYFPGFTAKTRPANREFIITVADRIMLSTHNSDSASPKAL